MLSLTNFWMVAAGLLYLTAGVIAIRKDIGVARGWEKILPLGSVFISASLAAFAPEHFHGPQFVADSVPSWMPGHMFWVYLVGCSLLAAATSLALKRFECLASILLGSMFTLFVCMIYVPSAIENYKDRFAWAFLLRDLSFAAGAWALAGVECHGSRPRASRGMIWFARIVLAVAGIDFGIQQLLHPEFSPGVPLELTTPLWVPLPRAWGYVAGGILLVAGIALAGNRKPRLAAGAIGGLMTVLVFSLYLANVFAGLHGSTEDFSVALNYFWDTLLYAGAALAVASALPAQAEGMEKA